MSTAELYAEHIKTLTRGTHAALESCGYDAVVIHSGRRVLRSSFDDMEHPFAVVPSFAHWSEIRWPGSVISVAASKAPLLLAYEHESMWEQEATPNFERMQAGLQVERHKAITSIKDKVPTHGKVAFIAHDAAEAEAYGLSADHFNPPALVSALEELRVLKSAYEVEAMAEANRAAVRGHRAIAKCFHGGERNELALQHAYLAASGQDATATPYGNIVALGSHAAVLHHRQFLNRPNTHSLLVDAGATHLGYAADITRTHAADRAPTAFAELVERVDAVQQRAADNVKIGASYEALHDAVHEDLAGELVELGLFYCSAEAAVQQGLTRALFPHGLGHSIGVQVHDVAFRKTEPREDNRFLRNTRVIEAHQAFTLEPGIYFIDALLQPLRQTAKAEINWSLVDELTPLGGVRIEDDVVVLPEGSDKPVRNLSREAFAD